MTETHGQCPGQARHISGTTCHDVLELTETTDGLSARTARRLYRATFQGQLSKAWRQLRASPPLLVGPHWRHQTAQKLFLTKAWPTSQRGLPTFQLATHEAVRRLKRQRAADYEGWTTESAQSCLEDARIRPLLLHWLHGQAVNTNPYSSRRTICYASTRVKAIGMLWTKALSHLAQARPDTEIHLQDKQFGIGTPQKGLTITMSIRAKLQENPDHVVASLDFKNAFCSLKREHCLVVLQKLCPHNPAWLDVVANPLALPQSGPLSTILFSTVMTETVNIAIR